MTTIHRRCLEEMVDDEFAGEAGREAAFGMWLAQMQAGGYEQAMIDAVVQKTFRSYDIYDAYVFAHVIMALRAGDLAWLRVPVGATPAPDREADANNRALAALPPGFKAEVYSGVDHDGDGWIECTKGQIFQKELRPENAFILPPTTFALEVGTTRASRTYLHLKQESCLARWPYGSDSVHLLYRLDRGRPQ
jgi:hypothetical protein